MLTTTDTFIVVDRKKYPSLVYAVLPVLPDHLTAARSVAMNIELQGVQCFYNTINYVLEDDNRIKVILELSNADHVDSIYFEQVTSAASLIKNVDRQKAIANTPLYTTTTDQPVSGTVYIRGRIKLKSGAVVYTEIIPVFTSGPKNILFYPNPVMRSAPLKYLTKQGISPDCRLQVYNTSGLLVREYASLPLALDVSLLIRGVYLFKLTDRNGKPVASEKIIIY